MLPKRLAFVDVETTGMRATYDRVIEVGILRVEDGKVVSTFNSLVNPDSYIPPEILEMTGINAAEVENAPSFYELKKEIKDLLADCVFVAHNVRFDYSFLKNEFRRFEMSFSPKQICTVKLSRSLFPEYRHHNLDALIERFGFECEKRHRAFDDAKVLWNFYQTVLQKFPEEKILESINRALKKPTMPTYLAQKDLDALPESPGVYIFYGDSGVPLYVGKSVSLRDRVMSHFSSDHSSSVEMKISQQVKSIETIQTVGELGALFKESEMVKRLQPLYNRKLRIKKDLWVLKRIQVSGYESVSLEVLERIEALELDSVLGVFKSRRQAREFLANVSKEHSLCEKLLGLEKTNSGCFGYRLGRCNGACLAKESVLKYNLRFYEAFSKGQIKPWPFRGPIIIKERAPFEESGEAFLIDKWCYLGNLKFGEVEKSSTDYVFDLDTYKIIESYIKSPKNARNIIPV